MTTSPPIALPPLDKTGITASVQAWLTGKLSGRSGPAERVRLATQIIRDAETALKPAVDARLAAALSIREYGPGATAPVPRRVRNVGLAEAVGISRPALQKARDALHTVPLVDHAADELPAWAVRVWRYEERIRLAREVRDNAVITLLANAWPNTRIAELADVNPSRIAQIKARWKQAGGSVNAAHLRGVLPMTTSPALPAEGQCGALDLLRRAIGRPLLTSTGATNEILSVTPSEAWVATSRSPQGQPVPVHEVQRGLDQLAAQGYVRISPDELGHHTTFIGALLSTLPNTIVEGPPYVLRLVGATEGVSTISSTAPALTFQGDLTIDSAGSGRGEQELIRRLLFGSDSTSHCALCGDELPVRFLWAAHIKRRAACSDSERRDIGNVAMAACVFGCDALYEHGYISVDGRGVVIADLEHESPALSERVGRVIGRQCNAFSAASASYFEWHRRNIWRGTRNTVCSIGAPELSGARPSNILK